MTTRDRIVNAAMELAGEDGLGSLSVRKVAAAAGIGASTLRHYFPTMGSLHEAILETQRREVFSDAALDDPTLPPPQRLAQALMQFLESADDAAFRRSTAEAHLAAISDEGFSRRVMGTSYVQAHAAVSHWLQRLADEGALSPANLNALADALVAFVAGLIQQRSYTTAKQADDALQALCFHLLRPRSPGTWVEQA